ncbi:unannotated protein [freshwater metagenome]|uniref:Unannotated protein n=1 Tax=freshwater metagenome TaxID=449393 RepID=A0A6J6S3F5_9ZZZZ
MHRLAARQQRAEEDVGVLHQPDDVLVAVVEHARDPGEVGQQRVDLVVLVGDVGRQRRDAVEGRLELLVAVAGQVGQGGQRGCQLVGVDLGGGLGQTRERLHHVVRRAGPLDRDLVVGVELAGAGRLERHEHRTEQGLHLDRGTRVGSELRVGVDAQADAHVVALQLDAVDLADADACDADLVVDLEPAGLGEGGVVGLATADQGQVLGTEGAHQQQHDRRDADGADGHWIALTEGLHRGPLEVVRGGSAAEGAENFVGWFIRDHTSLRRCCSRRAAMRLRAAGPGPGSGTGRS